MTKAYLCIVSDYEELKIVFAYFDKTKSESWLSKAKSLIDELDSQVDYNIREKYWNLKREEMIMQGITHYYYKFVRVEEIEVQ